MANWIDITPAKMKNKKEKTKKDAAVRALNWIDVETNDGRRYKIANIKSVNLLDYRDGPTSDFDHYPTDVATFCSDMNTGEWCARRVRHDLRQIVDGLLCSHSYLIPVFERPIPACPECKTEKEK